MSGVIAIVLAVLAIWLLIEVVGFVFKLLAVLAADRRSPSAPMS